MIEEGNEVYIIDNQYLYLPNNEKYMNKNKF